MFLSSAVRGCIQTTTSRSRNESSDSSNRPGSSQSEPHNAGCLDFHFGKKVHVRVLSAYELAVKRPDTSQSHVTNFEEEGFDQVMDSESHLSDKDEIQIPSNGPPEDGGEIQIPTNEPVKEPTPESPGSRSHYGEFFWDTNGENDYHISSFDDDLLLDLEGASAARLDRTQSDLNKFKQRIDNNVEQQKEYSEMMANLQNKVHDYRAHLAQLEKKLVTEGIRMPDKPLTTNIINVDSIDSTNTYIRDVEIWSPSRGLMQGGGAGGGMGTVLVGDGNANFEIRARLEDEMKRVEEYRTQWEHERAQRDRLEDENERLRRDYEHFEREYREKERSYINKNKNLTQYLSDEQQKMLDLWTDLQKVRKQFATLKQQTEDDLDNQRTEMKRMIRNVANVAETSESPSIVNRLLGAEGSGGNTNIDINFYELVKELRRGHGGGDDGTRAILEHLKSIRNVNDGEEITTEMYNDLIKKYESAINNNLELQKKLEDEEMKSQEQSTALRRNEEQLAEAHRGLYRILKISRRSDDRSLRTRSISPVPDTVPATESINAVRQAIRTRDNEIRRINEKMAQQQTQITELQNKLKSSEEARKRLDKQLEDARREIGNNQKAVEEMDRNRRRLEDRISAAQIDVEAAEKARLFAQSEVQKLQELLQQSTQKDDSKISDQLEQQASSMEEDFKERLASQNRRIEMLMAENSRLKAEVSAARDRWNDLNSSHSNLQRQFDEKNVNFEHLETNYKNIQDQIKNAKETINKLISERNSMHNEVENSQKTIQNIEQKMKDLIKDREQLLKEKAGLVQKFNSVQNKYEVTLRGKEDVERTLTQLQSDIKDLNERLEDRENQLRSLKDLNDKLDTAKQTYEGKIAQLEIDVCSRMSEIDKLSELNQKLQNEKQDILGQKLAADNSIETLKETTRKLEYDLNKTKNEIKALENKDHSNRSSSDQLRNQLNTLQRELNEALEENKDLKEQISELEERIRSKGIPGTAKRAAGAGPAGGRSTHTTTTTTTTIIKKGDSSSSDDSGEIHIPSNGPEDAGNGDQSDTQHDPAGSDGLHLFDDSLLMDVKLREINDHWRRQLDDLEKQNEDLAKQRLDSEHEVQHLQNEINNLKRDISEKERIHENATNELQRELKRFTERHIFENTIEREDAQENLNQRDQLIAELRTKIEDLQKSLADSQDRVSTLESEKIDQEMKFNSLNDQIIQLKNELEDLRSSSEKEIQKWKKEAYQFGAENKVLEGSNMALKAQLQSANSRMEMLEKNVSDDVIKIREQSSSIRQLEDQVNELQANLRNRENDLEHSNQKISELDDKLRELLIQANKWKSDLDQSERTNADFERTNVELETELNSLKTKLKSLNDAFRELKTAADQNKSEKERLKNALRDKVKQSDSLTKIVSKLENDLEALRTKMTDSNNKLLSTDSHRQIIERNLEKALKDLEFVNNQTKRKTDEYQSALGDLAHAQRVSEDGRLNAIQELESKRYENDDLKQRLANTEQRMIALQQDFIRVDTERDAMGDALRRFQSSASNIFNTRMHTDISSRFTGGGHGSDGGPGGATRSIKIEDDIGRELGHADDIDVPKSVPFPASYDSDNVGGSNGVHRTHTTDINITTFDITDMDNVLQNMLNKIRQLEMERNQLADEIARLKKKLNTDKTTVVKSDKNYRTIEMNLNDSEEEKRILQTTVESLKQVVRSQEDAFKERDEKRRAMKAKMATMELEGRERDAQLRHLKDNLKTLKTKLDESNLEVQTLRDKQVEYDANEFDKETRLRQQEREVLKYESTIVAYENGKQLSENTITELKLALSNSEHKLDKLQETIEHQKREITRLEKLENDIKQINEKNSQTAHEHQLLKDQLTSVQSDLNAAVILRQTLENQLNDYKNDVRNMKQRSQDNNNRISDLQRQLHEANMEKHRLEERIVMMDKTNNQQRSSENDLKQQIETLKNNKRTLEKDIDELKRRISQFELEKRMTTANMDNWSKEKQLLVKKIQLLEAEKRNTDAAIKETALQREAIEKSLNAMERENKELYKNCAQLQQQITQLEMENGNRILALTNKQRQEQELLLMRIQGEKSQIEKVIESKERTYKNRIKQLEQQIVILREQIDAERRRKRDYADRMLGGDIAPGLSSRTTYRTNIRETTPTFGRGYSSSFGPSTYVSNPLSPTLGTPTQRFRDRPPSSLHDQDLGIGRASEPRDPSVIDIPLNGTESPSVSQHLETQTLTRTNDL